MTLEEAIDQNQTTLCVPNSEFLKPKYQAIALGIEALKREQEQRIDQKPTQIWLLPGETKD